MNAPKDLSRDLVRVVSLNTDVTDHDAAVRRVADLVQRGEGGYVCFSTVHMVMEAYDSPEFAARVNGADMIVPDGMPIVWMQKLSGRRAATRVRANDLMILLCRYAESEGIKVGFYGGKPEVIDAIVERSKLDFPALKIAYAYSPPFRPMTPEEDESVTREINDAAPDILFMGLGCPKQENWMAAHKGSLKAVMLGVGASFDFFAGNVKESPAWVGRLGLEWLFRLFQEPRRLWRRYLVLNPRFMWQAARQLVSGKPPGN
jgi:N-acetylglucosaminyldiphosphoundecaprenol N-acetyl-beta-D-mannosaminyltransferase